MPARTERGIPAFSPSRNRLRLISPPWRTRVRFRSSFSSADSKPPPLERATMILRSYPGERASPVKRLAPRPSGSNRMITSWPGRIRRGLKCLLKAAMAAWDWSPGIPASVSMPAMVSPAPARSVKWKGSAGPRDVRGLPGRRVFSLGAAGFPSAMGAMAMVGFGSPPRITGASRTMATAAAMEAARTAAAGKPFNGPSPLPPRLLRTPRRDTREKKCARPNFLSRR